MIELTRTFNTIVAPGIIVLDDGSRKCDFRVQSDWNASTNSGGNYCFGPAMIISIEEDREYRSLNDTFKAFRAFIVNKDYVGHAEVLIRHRLLKTISENTTLSLATWKFYAIRSKKEV